MPKTGRWQVSRIESRLTRVGDLDVHYYMGGRGDPLVVIHGGGNSARTWLKNMEVFAQSYTVYVPDLPGFGRSEPLSGEYFIPELVDFIHEFSQKVGLRQFHLVGHSLGGGIALSYALKFPYRVTKLVLVNSLCLGREIATWVRVLSALKISRTLGVATLAIVKAAKWVAGLMLPRLDFPIPMSRASIYLGSCVTTIKEQAMVLLHRLSEVVVPTLVVWGAKDPILPVKQAYVAARLIPGCQVKVFNHCGHSVYRDDVPGFSRTVRGFLG